MQTKVKTAAELRAMRSSGQLLASVLQGLRDKVVVGVTTKSLADHAAAELKALGGQPSFLGYQGFPDVICISINDEVVHGIPSTKRIIRSGDIVGLDFGVTYDGMITDSAISVIAGQPLQRGHIALVKDTEAAMLAGIASVHDKVRTGDIGSVIEKFLNQQRYGIVRDLVGHGVGHEIHEDPNIPNFGRAGSGPWLQRGMTIAIEPMVTLGGGAVYIDRDGWTVKTRDGKRAAHFEHTVLITEAGSEILTTL